MKNTEDGKKRFVYKIYIIFILTLILSAGILFYGYILVSKEGAEQDREYGTYKYHIAIISNDTSSSFWNDVYYGAVKAGEKYNAFVEQTGDGLSSYLSMEDAINIAIYEKVDGILLHPSGEAKTREMIDKAFEHDIPVITLQTDVSDSKRQGFVGINDYFLGLEYGKYLNKASLENQDTVAVLFPGATYNETSQKWFCLGLNNAVSQENIKFDYKVIWDDRGLNNAEDVISDMIKDQEKQPDIIICLDEVITQSTCQFISDRGLSDRIHVIGSYISEKILEEINQGMIDSTITIDPEAMGRKGVDVLMTYKKYHMASYYTEVDTKLIEKSNVQNYMRKE